MRSGPDIKRKPLELERICAVELNSLSRKALVQKLQAALRLLIVDGSGLNYEAAQELSDLDQTLNSKEREAAKACAIPSFQQFVWRELTRLVQPAPSEPSLAELTAIGVESFTSAFRKSLAALRVYEDALRDYYANAPILPLKTPISHVAALAEDLVRKYETLPWDYEYLVPLPLPSTFANVIGTSYALADEIRLELLSEAERSNLASETHLSHQPEYKRVQALLEIQGSGPSPDFSPFTEHFVLRGVVKGYELVELPDPFDRAHSTSKQFLGLAMALKILALNRAPRWGYGVPWWMAEPKTDSPSELASQDAFRDLANEWLPPDEAACIGALEISTESDATLKKRMHLIASAFERDDVRLLNGGRWYFDSFCGSNELMQFVQATTTLEILLGDEREESKHRRTKPENQAKRKKDTSLTELLATKCGYLLGGTRPERERIIGIVEELYDKRSRIVHAGRTVIDDPGALVALREIARRVIEKELQFLGSP